MEVKAKIEFFVLLDSTFVLEMLANFRTGIWPDGKLNLVSISRVTWRGKY